MPDHGTAHGTDQVTDEVDGDLIDVGALRDLAVEVAEEAGRLLWERRHDVRTSVTTKSTPTDMVTEMDRASETLIVERLTTARPADGLIGEEGAARTGTSGLRWVLDPLDGTTNYLYGYPGWNVSIGVEADGVPVAGAVAVPALGETFAAAAGRGAVCNDRVLSLRPDPPALPFALVGTGFNYDPSVRVRQADSIRSLIDRVRDIRRGGAAATDLCSVAAGRLDAYYEHGLAPWDWCAGTVIAREAGSRVERLPSSVDGSDLLVAAHPDRFDELVDLLVEVLVVEA